MTNREYIINGLSRELGNDAFVNVIKKYLVCPKFSDANVKGCLSQECIGCLKKWLERESGEVSECN